MKEVLSLCLIVVGLICLGIVGLMRNLVELVGAAIAGLIAIGMRVADHINNSRNGGG